MDDKIVWSSNNTANVANDVAERLVEERDDIHYLNGEPSTDADADLDESDSEDDAETETQTEDG